MYLLNHPGSSLNRLFVRSLGAFLFLSAATAGAENYQLNLTRKGANAYRVDGQEMMIQTRYCYAYAYSEEVIFKSTGYGGEVIFLGSKDKCDVKAVYGENRQQAGKYAVTVSREDDDWYQVLGTNSYIRTWSCISLALGEDALLTVIAPGMGRLRFKDGNDCMVEGVYSKIRL